MKRRDEVLVGIVATVALVAGFIGALWLARGGIAPGYVLYSKFVWGAGLKQGQPVLLAGVNVGFVDDVKLRPDGMLVITMRVRKEYKVPRSTTATIEPNGFFGDVMVALQPHNATMANFAVGDTIPTGRPTPSIGDVLSRVDTLTGHLSALAGALRKELVDDKGLADLRATVTKANALFAELQKLAADQNVELTRTQASLRKMATAIDSTKVDSTFRAISSAASSVKDLAADLRATTARLDSLADKVNKGPGTAGKLMNDAGLYNDMRSTLQRLDSLMADFQKNPKKYIKLSIF
ncbi:MAG: MlaD family protein [Gemmatimonadetes bacterium]|nr:MlaD family protein [Gemmatimonadota bacterium]